MRQRGTPEARLMTLITFGDVWFQRGDLPRARARYKQARRSSPDSIAPIARLYRLQYAELFEMPLGAADTRTHAGRSGAPILSLASLRVA
jgi:hypothetical protein